MFRCSEMSTVGTSPSAASGMAMWTRFPSPVWKSTSVSGAPDNSSRSHFSAITRPSWLGRAVRNDHRHAIEQASRRWRGRRREDSGRSRREILIYAQQRTFCAAAPDAKP